MTMKKSVIKRRKRVVPATQGDQAALEVPSNSVGPSEAEVSLPSSEDIGPRGSTNQDGSVSLGFRRPVQEKAVFLSSMRIQNNPPQLPDLTAYASNGHQHHHEHHNQHEHPDSLSNDNRLPPIASYPPEAPQRPSLSPNSFLSPSRKRSFSATEMEPRPGPTENGGQAQRLSSIKSILNPKITNEQAIDPSLRSESSNGAAARPSGSDQEKERRKTERKEALQREAERMREELRAVERDLAELAESD